MRATVLITTAISPPEGIPALKMTDPVTRFVMTKAAIFFWAAQGIGRLVIADATGSTVLNNDDISVLRQMNVDVEQISYQQNNALVRQKGKGYGEGALIDFALDNSAFLKQSDSFFKCTGKVYCPNFDKIFQMIRQNDITSIFWRRLDDGDAMLQWTENRFFYTTPSFAKKHLVPAYLMSDDAISTAEYNCALMLQALLPSAKSLRPFFAGFGGGTGEQYFDQSMGVLDNSFPCWVGVRGK